MCDQPSGFAGRPAFLFVVISKPITLLTRKLDMVIIEQSVEKVKHFSTHASIFFMDTIGERLRHYATTKHKRIKIFEEKLGLAQGTLSHYISNNRQPGTEMLQKFREDGLSIDWLLTGEGEMEVPKKGDLVEIQPGNLPTDRIIIIDIDQNRALTEEEIKERIKQALSKR